MIINHNYRYNAFCNDAQYMRLKDELAMCKGNSYWQFLTEIVNEKATYSNGGLHLSSYDLTPDEKRILLTYIVDESDLDDLLIPIRLDILFKEHQKEIAKDIKEIQDRLYFEAMEESYLYKTYHHDNGEIRWIKR